jgi:hypothetical protein
MIDGMTTVKRAVTIDEELDREAQELAGNNFSAFVGEALRRQVRVTKLHRLVQEDSDQRGALADDEMAAVGDELRRLDR